MIDSRYLTIQGELNLTFMEFMILILVYEEQYDFIRIPQNDNFMEFNRAISRLESFGLIKWHGNNPEEIILRKAGEDLFKKHVGKKKKIFTAKEVGQWFQSWREIFPEGVNSGGYRYRGDKAEGLKKMIKFVNDNSYTVEQIFQATRDHVERFSLKGYAYMQQAHFFIYKQGVGSNLANECESLSERKPKKEGEQYGRSVV
jgi:hypothetical protein